MQIVKHYRDNGALRGSFNALAEKSFGLNFEGWYQNGFWGDNYDPYSVVMDGQVVANVSVNRTDMVIGGQRRRLIQLGTVMTEESCRHRGLIRAIMEEIERDFGDVDGVYLFANDGVLDFYPKFGFRKATEYQYAKQVAQDGACEMENLPMDTREIWDVLGKAMQENRFRGGCDMVDNPGLIFFYVSQFMQECVFYCKRLDAYAIAEREGENLVLHNVFAKEPVTLDAVIGAFGEDVKQVTLGFAPADASGYEKSEIHEEDTTTFVKGAVFDEFEANSLRFPTLAHA